MLQESYNLKLTRIPKIIMLITGVYSEKFTRSPSKIIQRCFKTYSIFLLSLNYAIMSFHFFACIPTAIRNESLQVVAFGIANGLAVIKSSYKATICLNPRMTKLVLKCFSEYQESHGLYYDKEVKKEFKKNSKFFNTFFNVISVCVFTNFIFLEMATVFSYFKSSQDGKSHSYDMSDAFPFPNYPGVGLLYKLTAILIALLYNMLVFLYFLTPMTYACTQLKAIQILTENLKAKEDSLREIKNIIMWHQSVIRFIGELNDLVSFSLLIDYIATVLALAAIMAVDLMPDNTPYYFGYSTGLLCLYISQLFLMSWQANEIYVQSTEISDSLAGSKWYDQSKEIKQIVHIMILRTQRPLTINVGIFFPMTLNSAVTTVKLAYSYATMALTMQ